MSRGKGIILFSGGLDSLLAACLLMDQDLELIGFHGVLPFVAPDAEPATLVPVRLAAGINLPVHLHRCGAEYIDMVRNPPHGYGKNVNPCIDCHAYFIRKAADLMKEMNADFVATGEVVGQRPMSQMRHTMNHIEKVTGLKGRLLRPLSAQLLKPTIPEEEGIVRRDLLLGIHGRSRKEQFELAERYGIREYVSPSGGCLFTDRNIALRVRDLFDRQPACRAIDLYLLTVGRHFRMQGGAKVIVGRNEKENSELEKYRESTDSFFCPEFKGPSALARGPVSDTEIQTIGALLLRYGKVGPEGPVMTVYAGGAGERRVITVKEMSDEDMERMRI